MYLCFLKMRYILKMRLLISLHNADIDIEPHASCDYDYVQVLI